jgi:hypothetical protein
VESIIREAREMEVHPDNTNREGGFSLSKAWKPLLQTLMEGWKEGRKAPFSKEK